MWDDPPTARELHGFTVEVACGSCRAREGLVGLAATNANAMVAATTGGPPVFSTNPIAFGFPLGEDMPPLVIDQSCSATACVNIVTAAAEGRAIPIGWAVDAQGADTQDAKKGARGCSAQRALTARYMDHSIDSGAA